MGRVPSIAIDHGSSISRCCSLREIGVAGCRNTIRASTCAAAPNEQRSELVLAKEEPLSVRIARSSL
jgi:hypothetical protein